MPAAAAHTRVSDSIAGMGCWLDVAMAAAVAYLRCFQMGSSFFMNWKIHILLYIFLCYILYINFYCIGDFT